MAPESEDLFAEVAMLRDRVDELNKSVSVLTRYSPFLADLVKAIEEDALLGEVLWAVDGVRTQGEIVAHLKSRDVPKSSQPSVSRRLLKLREEFDLVKVATRTQRGEVYVLTDFARSLKITRALMARFAKSKPKTSS